MSGTALLDASVVGRVMLSRSMFYKADEIFSVHTRSRLVPRDAGPATAQKGAGQTQCSGAHRRSSASACRRAARGHRHPGRAHPRLGCRPVMASPPFPCRLAFPPPPHQRRRQRRRITLGAPSPCRTLSPSPPACPPTRRRLGPIRARPRRGPVESPGRRPPRAPWLSTSLAPRPAAPPCPPPHTPARARPGGARPDSPLGPTDAAGETGGGGGAPMRVLECAAPEPTPGSAPHARPPPRACLCRRRPARPAAPDTGPARGAGWGRPASNRPWPAAAAPPRRVWDRFDRPGIGPCGFKTDEPGGTVLGGRARSGGSRRAINQVRRLASRRGLPGLYLGWTALLVVVPAFRAVPDQGPPAGLPRSTGRRGRDAGREPPATASERRGDPA
jgi:hypothetical protein